MPAHPRLDNLQVTFDRWVKRAHPAACLVCTGIWGKQGQPKSFNDYASRYPDLDRGAKRHLTKEWDPGLTLLQVAANSGCDVALVRQAIANGMLEASTFDGQLFVSRTHATLWSKHGSPIGASSRSWVSVDDAEKRYGFSRQELEAFIASGQLRHIGGGEATQVSRIQCGVLRDQHGYSPEHAAARLGIPLSDIPPLLKGLEWRPSDGLIPLAVIRAAAKRLGERKRAPKAPTLDDEAWIVASKAVAIAGVSLATLGRWASAELVARRYEAGGWRYRAADLQVQARNYWDEHPTRAGRPAWLKASTEAPATAAAADQLDSQAT